MGDQATNNHTISVNQDDDALTPEAQQVLFQGLDAAWSSNRSSQKASLKSRHEFGKLLNDTLGKPGTRQKRGQGVIKKVAEKFGISKSDISRMRKFANEFETFETITNTHPDVSTWTEVKKVLTGSDGNKRRAPQLRPQTLLKRLTSALDEFKRLDSAKLSEVDRQLFEKAKERLQEVSQYLDTTPKAQPD